LAAAIKVKCSPRPGIGRAASSLILAIVTATGGTRGQAIAQTTVVRKIGTDSVLVIPGEIYRAGSLHQALLGENYRYEWTTPITVPILDLRAAHGGLTPTKEGGGMQAKNLHFVTADSSEYVFRQVKKTDLILGPEYRHTLIWYIVRDEGSASHPTGALAAAPLLAAARVLHPTPQLYFMPDDPALGEFRKDFAGVLGTLEEFPNVPKEGHAFLNADKIIDSDDLLEKINADATTRVDARALLTARLMDMLIGDNDRHPDQWEWARFGKDDTDPYEPIPRDRDKAFVSYEGLLLSIARLAVPSLVTFRDSYPDPSALFANAGEFDRRMLQGLDRNVWDSVANSLTRRITDQVIDDAVMKMPGEYGDRLNEIASTLKSRRNGLRRAADQYYSELWKVADIHGTDADEQLTVTRSPGGLVDVVIQSGNAAPYFSRRFDPRDTREIRVYLHGGNDRAIVRGAAARSIPLRIIGGNGTNFFTDESTVGGKRNQTRFYDAGAVTNVKYAKDTIDEKANIDMAFNHSFNRRPWLRAYGTLIPPQKDRGNSFQPIASLHSQRGLGIYPEIGVRQYDYGFRKVPYASMRDLRLAYSPSSNRMRIRTAFDKRLEESDVHVPVTASMSQFEVVEFHGFGNDVPDLRGRLYDVRLRQWQLRPAIGRSLNAVSDVSLGPVVKYSTTDSLANRFIAQQQPYGFTRFGQAGLQLKAHLESRDYADTLRPRLLLDVAASGYPGMWDVAKPYESLDAWAASYITFNIPKKPVLALRFGGKKLWGPFPYFDAAFLGGSETFRTEEKQRYAGDASLYGTTELRVPIAKFPLIVPLDVGAIGFVDAGKVYLNGESPGGWHTAAGAGFWVGFLDPGKSVNILFTDRSNRRVVTNVGFAF
jgi:hypothetical protein